MNINLIMQKSFCLLFVSGLLTLLSFNKSGAQATITFDNVPPLSGGGNTAGGVCFNFTTNQSITIHNLRNAFSTTSGTCNIWYNPNKINGQPTINAANGWINLGTATFTGQSTGTANPIPQTIPIPLNLVMQPNDTFGFAIQWTGNVYPTTNTNIPTFSDGTVTIIADANCAFTFNSAMSSFFTPRQINGGVIYSLNNTGPNNTGVSELNAPSAFCAGTQDIKVNVRNFGNNLIDSVQIHWQLNGIAQAPYNLTLPLDTFGGIGLNVREVTLGNYSFTNTPVVLKAWTHLPNGVSDTVNNNDTLSTTLQSSMSGIYTVNSANATGGTNYQTFSELIDDLNNYGVCGSVTVNVTPNSGPYNEVLYFEDIIGASPMNTIRINGNGVTVEYNNDVNNRQMLRLIGTKYLTIDSLHFKTLNTTYGWGAIINGGAAYDSIINCTFDLSSTTSTSSANTSGIIMSGSLTAVTTAGANVTNCYIANNTIQGPTGSGGYYYAMTMTSGADSNVIENNNFYDFYYYGIYISAAKHNVIRKNKIARPTKTAVTTFYGIYTTGAMEGTIIDANEIYRPGGITTNATSTGYGLYTLGKGTVTAPIIISNNVVHSMNTGGTSYGVYLSSATHTKVMHNTIVYDQIQTGTSNQAGIWTLGTNTGLEIINNIIYITGGNTGTKYGYNFTTAAALSSTANAQRNNIYVNSTQTGNQWHSASPTATTYATLAAFQTANPTLEIGSLDVDPLFANTAIGNFTPTNPLLENNGIDVSNFVPLDFDGKPRSSTPTPGAFDMAPLILPDNDAGISQFVAPIDYCPGAHEVKVKIINEGGNIINNLEVHWEMNGIAQTPYIHSTALDTAGGIGVNEVEITLGTYNFTSSFVNLKAWTTAPNGLVDTTNNNDTLSTVLQGHNEPIVNLGNDTTICFGDTILLDAGNVGSNYLWNDYSNGQTLTIDGAGQYYVTITNFYGCQSSDTIVVNVYPAPTGDFSFTETGNGYFNFEANANNAVSYTWDFGDGSTPITMNSPGMFKQYNTEGSYTVTLTLKNECGDSITISHNLEYLSLNNLTTDENIFIFPNPTKEYVIIENQGKNKIENIIIYDAVGRIVKQKNTNKSSNTIQINLSTWPEGIYNISLTTSQGIIHKRFTIAR